MNLCPVLVLTKSVDQRKIVVGVRIIGVSIEIGIQKLGRLLQQRLSFNLGKLAGLMKADEAIKRKLSEVVKNWRIGRVAKMTAS